MSLRLKRKINYSWNQSNKRLERCAVSATFIGVGNEIGETSSNPGFAFDAYV